jgi:hypothetical protein
VPKQYPFLISGLLVVSVAAMFSRNRRVQGVLSVTWLLIALAYLVFIPVMSRIVGHE